MEKELVLFSGGRDSFITAITRINEGKKVELMTFNNGCIQGIENVNKTANMLLDKYGEEYVKILPVKSCITDFFFLRDLYLREPIIELSKQYPDLLINQLNCICCKSAMYIEAIKYCLKSGITVISEGARKSQSYLVQKNLIIKEFRYICNRYGIELKTPVYDIENNYAIKLMMAENGFLCAKTYEAQCWMGVPEGEKPSPEQMESIENFFVQKIKPRINNLLNNLE